MSREVEFSIFWYDYVLFGVMLGLSTSIGIYFGCFGNKYSTRVEYLMGNKQMKPFPVACSTIACFISAIAITGIPADVYQYGAAYLMVCFAWILSCIITCTIFLPVLFNLEVKTIFEYLNRRFDNNTRKLIALFYIVNGIIYLPFVIYIPILILSLATGFDFNLLVLIISGICIFYTAIGGFKTVIWTDNIQIIFCAITILTIFVLGQKTEGGLHTVWKKAKDGNRLNFFDFNFDPTERDTFWAVVVGLTSYFTCSVTNQTHMQKLMAVPTLRDSILAQIYYSFGSCIFDIFLAFIGLMIYAKYSTCDPVEAKQIEKSDQLLLLYVTDVAKVLPGFSGLFFAGLFSASLSTQSAYLNGLAGVIYEDFLKHIIEENISERKISCSMKAIVVVLGIVTSCLIFVTARLSNILSSIISLLGALSGPKLAVFTLGVLFPRANSKGAFYGGIIGFLCTASIVIPTKYYQYKELWQYQPKPVSTDNCTSLNESLSLTRDLFSINNTTIFQEKNTTFSSEFRTMEFQPLFIFRISHYYYAFIGFLITIIFGLLISYITGHKNDPPVDRTLLSPMISKRCM